MLAESWDVVGDVVLVTGLVLSCASLVPRFLRRKQPRCPTCSYDLTGVALTPVPKCPECGKQARSAKRLFRGRVHRRLLASGVMLSLLCNVPYSVPRVEEAGWVGAFPTTALALWYPYFTPDRGVREFEATGPIEAEFVRRFVVGLQSGTSAPGPIISRIMALRCELAFRWAGRWGVSDEERAALLHIKADLPFYRTSEKETVASYLKAIEATTDRPTRIDADGFLAVGLDPTTLIDVVIRSPSCKVEYSRGFPIQSESSKTDPTSYAFPACLRGEVILTPRPMAYGCTMTFPPLPRSNIVETARLLSTTCTGPWSMFGTLRGSQAPPSIVVLGNQILMHGSEPALAYAQHVYALASQPTPTPWSPIWLFDVAKARDVFEKLDRTRLPRAISRATVPDALDAIKAACGIEVQRDSKVPESPQATLFVDPYARECSATEILDALARRIGYGGGWDISPQGTVELVTHPTDYQLVDLQGNVAIYDISGLTDHAGPNRSWFDLLFYKPAGELYGFYGATTEYAAGSRGVPTGSLVFHFRLERSIRSQFEATKSP